MSSITDYFTLKKAYPFYGAYHTEWRNKAVHVCCVPMLFATSLTFASYLRVPASEITPAFTGADAAALFYAVSFIVMDPIAGSMYAPLIAAMHHVGTGYLRENMGVAVGIQAVAWAAQFFAHAVFERRKPALADSFFQSIHAAVFFVWLEVLFEVGYRPGLHKELEVEIAKVKSHLKKVE